MVERFVTPCTLPTPRQREILTIVAEEAAEVIQRATKALRFGLDEVQPGQELSNAQRLAEEIGDLEEIIALAVRERLLRRRDIDARRPLKQMQLIKFMQTEHSR